MFFRNDGYKVMDDFVVDGKKLPNNLKSSPLKIGKRYATSLTGFLAGIVVGMLSMYILLTLYAK